MPTSAREDEAFAADLVYVANLSNEAARCYPVVVAKAKAHQARVAANPGIRQLQHHGRAFQETLSSLDILSLNRVEAEQVASLLDRDETEDGAALPPASDGRALPPLAERGLTFERRHAGLAGFSKALIRRGVGHVLLTDGRDGAYAASGHTLLYCPAHEGAVAGTAGAGDAFAATFSAYVVRGCEPDVALRAATLNAASVLAHVDTQTGLLGEAALARSLGGNSSLPRVSEWCL